MKTLLLSLLTAIVVLVALIKIPAETKTIVIIKSQIHENRPFAGILNDEYMGPEVCCEYWLVLDKCPDTAYYLVQKSLLGNTISLKDITP